MTYISISSIILGKTINGQLHAFCPRSPISQRFRQLYLSEEVHEELYRTGRNTVEEQRVATLEATLELFIAREKLAPSYIKGLTPPGCGVWEIKCWKQPAIRVFGMFMRKDVFVATHTAYRDDLGEFGTREWNFVVRRCQTHIKNLFHPYGPLMSDDINQVISGALNEKYFRN